MEDMVRDSARQFATREKDLKRLREARGRLPGYDTETLDRAAALGWMGILIPEAYGGLSMQFADMAAVMEELGKALLGEPIVAIAVLAARTLLHGDNEDLKRELLLRVAGGEAAICLAWQERAATLAASRIETRVTVVGGRHVLEGSKRFVAGAGSATGFLVSAQAPDGIAVYYVRADAAGVELAHEWRADGTPSGRLQLRGVEVDHRALVAGGSKGEAVLARALDEAAVMAAAEAMGVMTRAFELTLEHLRTRVQFGKPLGSFQVLQHKMADLYMQREIAAAVLKEAVGVLDDDAQMPRRALAASRAKSRCAEAGMRIAREAIQLHGAMGFTDECDVGLYFKRLVFLSAWLGNADLHRQRFARERHALARDDRPTAALTPPQVRDLGLMMALPVERRDWNPVRDEDFATFSAHIFRENLPPALKLMPRRPTWKEVEPWYVALSRAGWLAPAWPVEHGGMGLDPAKLLVYYEQMGKSGAPRHLEQGINYIGPLLIARGTEEQKATHLPPILSGQHIWCQGYSEPGAGSDLASLRTEAVREGDEFVINGQKIWTTMAHQATHMYALVRTDKTLERHAGLSLLILDMKSPGITVRPIRNIKGHDEFCEVFLENVRTPAANLIGAMNDGWQVARTLLGFERNTTGSPRTCFAALDRLEIALRGSDLDADPAVLDRVTRAWMDVSDFASLYEQFVQSVKAGANPGPQASILKTCATETLQGLTELLVEILGDAGYIAGAQDFGGVQMDVLMPFLDARSTTISAGSSQVQRNVLAKRVLNL